MCVTAAFFPLYTQKASGACPRRRSSQASGYVLLCVRLRTEAKHLRHVTETLTKPKNMSGSQLIQMLERLSLQILESALFQRCLFVLF